jgi:hypothetical protein
MADAPSKASRNDSFLMILGRGCRYATLFVAIYVLVTHRRTASSRPSKLAGF